MIWWIMNDLNIILKGEPHLTDGSVGRSVGPPVESFSWSAPLISQNTICKAYFCPDLVMNSRQTWLLFSLIYPSLWEIYSISIVMLSEWCGRAFNFLTHRRWLNLQEDRTFCQRMFRNHIVHLSVWNKDGIFPQQVRLEPPCVRGIIQANSPPLNISSVQEHYIFNVFISWCKNSPSSDLLQRSFY